MPDSIKATADRKYAPATKPTMYFIGMTTGKSSIMRVFPRWAAHLNLGEVVLQGIDCQWHDDPAVYRRIVEFIKGDPLSLGALVTTHKIDLFQACRELFDYLEPHAEFMGEVSCLAKRDGQLHGQAVDFITSGLALEAFLPSNHWQTTGAEVFCLGAGGSAIAVTSYLMDPRHGANRPSRIRVANRSTPRLAEMEAIHHQLDSSVPVTYHHTPHPEDSDALMNQLKPHSLVINATGLGKDAPGSPITEAGVFPEHGFAWDFNYRGHLVFLEQARAQAKRRDLAIEDGWRYFIHGWTRVMAEVFAVNIPASGPEFARLSQIAQEVR